MDERNEAIWAAVESGMLFRIIAAEHGVTIARIRQIHERQCRKKGVRGCEGRHRPPPYRGMTAPMKSG